MKKILFATTATAALAFGGMASAQGISLFGDARLGLGYGINNEGGVERDENGDAEDLRALSRVRFGVEMTGETNSGITFGATIRADNSAGGQGGKTGQRSGDVFVSGAFGTLTFGDTNGADEQAVGDLLGNESLTGLGDLNETAFISNGGSFGSDGNGFFDNPEARPTIRYDFEISGFTLSASTNRDLTDVGVGAAYAGEFGGGTFNVGVGYYDFNEFTIPGGTSTETVAADLDGDGVDEDVEIEVANGDTTVEAGQQYSAVIGGTFGDYGANVIYINIEDDDRTLAMLGIGASAGFGDFDVGAYYNTVIDADNDISYFDGADSYGVTASYDLGGGAKIAGGVVRTYDTRDDDLDVGEEAATVADFGIKMSF